MQLIIGGANQNKSAWCQKEFGRTAQEIAEGGTISCAQIPVQPILNHLHLWIKRMLEAGQDPAILVELYRSANPNAIILCDEIGNGVVPMDRSDRVWREVTGRICCDLAKKADRVDRLFCGIPTILKQNNAEEKKFEK